MRLYLDDYFELAEILEQGVRDGAFLKRKKHPAIRIGGYDL
jgi:hypothetical protein